MTDESEYTPDPEFIGMETGVQIDTYFVSIALYRMPSGGIRYVADAADTANDEYEGLRCVADRDFESEHAAASAGGTLIWQVVRAHQGLPDDSHTLRIDPESDLKSGR